MSTKKCNLLAIVFFISLFFQHSHLAMAITDTTAPEISNFRFTENGQVLKAGDTLHLSVKITDESEIESANVWLFRVNEGSSSTYFSLTYNNSTGRWEGSYKITKDDNTGCYYLSVHAKDIYGNWASLSPSENNTFYVNEIVTDTTAPEISNFRFTENGQVLKAGDTLHLSVKITDESEIESANVWLFRVNEGSSSTYFSLTYNNNTGRWEGSYKITEDDNTGCYYLSVHAEDIYGNWASLSPSENNTFYVNEIVTDLSEPEITDFKFKENGKILNAGNTLHVTVKITDESEIESANVWLFRVNEGSSSTYFSLIYNNNTGRWEGSYKITKDDKIGNYYLSVHAKDIYGNWASLSPSENNTFSVTKTTDIMATKVVIRNSAGKIITGKTVNVSSKTWNLNVAAMPAEAAQQFTWKSSNTKIAAVDGTGKVTFKKAGTVTITAITKDGSGKSAWVKLKTDIKATRVVVRDPDGTNVNGKTIKVSQKIYQLSSLTKPIAFASQKIDWKSSNTKIATVDGTGKVTFKKAGTVKITAVAKDGSGKSAWVKLKTDIKTTKIVIRNSAGKKINHKTIKISNKNYLLSARAKPIAFVSQKINWKSSNTKIATVDKTGKVTFKKAGTVKITAAARDGSGKSNWVKITYEP